MQIQIPYVHEKMGSYYVVYTLHHHSQLYWIGACRFDKLLSVPDAAKKSAFDRSAMLTLTLISVHASAAEAYHAQSAAIERALPKPSLLIAQSVAPVRTVVRCDVTGKTWLRLRDCAIERGIYESALSAHLARKPGHKSLRGYTYSKVPLDIERDKNLLAR